MAVINVRQNTTSTSSQDEVQLLANEIQTINDIVEQLDLTDLADVTITAVQDGEVLVYDAGSGEWVNGEGNFVAELNDLTDVTITSPSQGDLMVYNTGEFQNGTIATLDGGVYGDIGTGVDVTGTRVLNYWEEDVSGNLLPAADATFNIGSPTRQVNELYLTGSTMYLGGVPLSIDNGDLKVNGQAISQGTGVTDYNDLTNKPQLFSGSYNDLTNKPQLFSGNYNDLTNKPNLAENFSGSYNDLVDKPQIFSGNYNDLTNKPQIFDGNYNNLSNKPSTTSPSDIQNILNAIKDNFSSIDNITDLLFDNGDVSVSKQINTVTVDVEILRWGAVQSDDYSNTYKWSQRIQRLDGTNLGSYDDIIDLNVQGIPDSKEGINPAHYQIFYVTVTGFGKTETYLTWGTQIGQWNVNGQFYFNKDYYPVIDLDFQNSPVELVINYRWQDQPIYKYPVDMNNSNSSSNWTYDWVTYTPQIDSSIRRDYNQQRYYNLPRLDAKSTTTTGNSMSATFDFSKAGFVYHGLDLTYNVVARREDSPANQVNGSFWNDQKFIPILIDINNNKQYADLTSENNPDIDISSISFRRQAY